MIAHFSISIKNNAPGCIRIMILEASSWAKIILNQKRKFGTIRGNGWTIQIKVIFDWRFERRCYLDI